MLGMVAWVVMAAVIASLFALLQVIREKTEELSNSIYEDDDGTDEWLA
jgi:hypothetical protein